jgi:predicted Zn-dependent protease
MRPCEPGCAYVYAVALHDTGRANEAISVLTDLVAMHASDPDVLRALVSYSEKAGRTSEARDYSTRLRALEGE